MPSLNSQEEKDKYMAALFAGEIPFPLELKGMGIKNTNVPLVSAALREGVTAFYSAALPGHLEIKAQKQTGERRNLKERRAMSEEINRRVIRDDIAGIRSEFPLGILGVNDMKALGEYEAMLEECGKSQMVDILEQGAGFDRYLSKIMSRYPWMHDSPIVTSIQGAQFYDRLARKAGRKTNRFYYENPRFAGAHLGALSVEQATDEQIFDPERFMEEMRAKLPDIPVIYGGGVSYWEDIERVFAMGFNGVGMGTRFLLTQESGMPDETIIKKYLNPDYEVAVSMQSPTGFPSRHLINPEMVDRLEAHTAEIRKGIKQRCIACIGGGDKCKFILNQSPYCIAEDLAATVEGEPDGVLFTGTGIAQIRQDPIYYDNRGNLHVPTVAEMVDFVLNPDNKPQ